MLYRQISRNRFEEYGTNVCYFPRPTKADVSRVVIWFLLYGFLDVNCILKNADLVRLTQRNTFPAKLVKICCKINKTVKLIIDTQSLAVAAAVLYVTVNSSQLACDLLKQLKISKHNGAQFTVFCSDFEEFRLIEKY